MAQEFASDNSQNGLFSRLKLSNHRGFFSFIFVTLSIIFILITFAAVQQQQTTQSKADTNLCPYFSCNNYVSPGFTSGTANKLKCDNHVCCKSTLLDVNVYKCNNDTNGRLYCKNFNSYTESQKEGFCKSFPSTCEWTSSRRCIETGSNPPATVACAQDGEIINRISNPNQLCCNGLPGERVTGGPGSQIKCVGNSPASSTCVKEGVSFDVREGKNCCPSSESGPIVKLVTNLPNGSTRGTCDRETPILGAQCLTDTGLPIGTCGTTSDKLYCDSRVGTCLSCDGTVTNDNKCSTVVNPNLCATQAGPGVLYYCDAQNQRVPCDDNSGSCLKSSVVGQDLPSSGTCNYGGTNGTWKSGLCSGVPNVKCCSKGTTNPPPPPPPPGSDGGDPIVIQPPAGETGNVELDLKLAFQGIVTLPKTKTQLKIKVKLVDDLNNVKVNNDTIFTANTSGIWSGIVTFSDVDLSKKYYLLIKGPMHLQKKICDANAADPNPDSAGYYSCQFGNITLRSGVNVLPGGVNPFDFSKVTMLAGDLDQNGFVNREDTEPLQSALLLEKDQRKSSAILEKLDLNLDGIVEPKDWDLMLAALKIKYDEK